MDECLICGATTDLTVEHIIPQTLWNRFGIDPNGVGDVAKTRTILCSTCNSATGQLHERGAMLDLIAEGAPVTKQTLRQLADWTFWVTILLGLARGAGVLPISEARRWLQDRFFSGNQAGVPRGLRVYAGRSADLAAHPVVPTASYAVSLMDDPSVVTNQDGRPIGYSAHEGTSVQAAEVLGLGSLVLLVVGRAHSSGPDHTTRLDSAVASAGLVRIHPLPTPIPTFATSTVSVAAAHELFVREPLLLGVDLNLLPVNIRRVVEAFTARPNDWPSSPTSR